MSWRRSSFYWAMRLLGERRRRAMVAVYGFCRAVDDIADDGDDLPEQRLRELSRWRSVIEALGEGAPPPEMIDLAEAVREFRLDKADLLAVVDGMAMDARAQMRRPSQAVLALYCDRVAAAVGRLTLAILGFPGGEELAAALGEALQLTNILRDLAEDAQRGRLYLPDELLAAHGIAGDDPALVLAHPALPLVCGDLAAQAKADYARAAALMAGRHCRRLRPVGLMAAVYGRQLRRLEAADWQPIARMGFMPKLILAIRWVVHPDPWNDIG